MRRVLSICVLAATAAAAGCSDNKRVAVEGSITYDGKPIPMGTITFLPLFEGGIKAGDQIANGHYKLEAPLGLFPGPHKVEIRWAKPTGKKYKNEFGEEHDRTAEGLPDKYHANTTLTADIKPRGNTLDFNLER
jgi:hypothetical protein